MNKPNAIYFENSEFKEFYISAPKNSLIAMEFIKLVEEKFGYDEKDINLFGIKQKSIYLYKSSNDNGINKNDKLMFFKPQNNNPLALELGYIEALSQSDISFIKNFVKENLS